MRAAMFTVSPRRRIEISSYPTMPRDDRAGMHADAHAQVGAAAPPAFGDEVAHLKRGLHDILGCVEFDRCSRPSISSSPARRREDQGIVSLWRRRLPVRLDGIRGCRAGRA